MSPRINLSPRLIVLLVFLALAYVSGMLPVFVFLAIPALMIRGWWCSSHDMARIGRRRR